MEEYANYGFSYIADKLEEDKGYFFSKRAFLDVFLELTDKNVKKKRIRKKEKQADDLELL